MSNFQIAIMGIFLAFAAGAVLLFTGVIPGSKTPQGGFGGEVVLWGDIPGDKIMNLVNDFNQEHKKLMTLKYIYKRSDVFETELIEALASGSGPDLFFLSQDSILKDGDKIFKIPFTALSERDFKNSFIEEGELYLAKDGMIALPFLVDPLVMYWNRDMFSSAGIAREPLYWDELFTISPILTKIDNAKNIKKSAIAFGEFVNVANAKDILGALFIQSGDNITARNYFDGKMKGIDIAFGKTSANNTKPAESSLRFFTEFSNSSKPSYSWNRSLPNSKTMFVSEDLAMYFGYASELPDILAKNPHLNFSVSLFPQIRDSSRKATFGKMKGLAIAKNSRNTGTAFQAAFLLSGASFLKGVENITNLPPVRRDMLSKKQSDLYKSVFYESAIISKGWLDPKPDETYNIFKDMVSNISSGRKRVSEAILGASNEMERLVR